MTSYHVDMAIKRRMEILAEIEAFAAKGEPLPWQSQWKGCANGSLGTQVQIVKSGHKTAGVRSLGNVKATVFRKSYQEQRNKYKPPVAARPSVVFEDDPAAVAMGRGVR